MEAIEVDAAMYDNLTNPDDIDTLGLTFGKAIHSKKPKKHMHRKHCKRSYYEPFTDNFSFKKFFKKVGSGIKKGVQGIGSAIKNVGIAAAFAPLLPLKGIMVKALNKKKIPHGKGIHDIAVKFYENVVKKSSSGAHYDEIHLDDYEPGSDHFAVAVAAIVEGIISFVKDLKSKKDSGQKLSPIESEIADGTTAAQNMLTQKAKDEAAQKVGSSILFNPKTRWYIIGAVVLIIIITIFAVRHYKKS